jgi:serine/threonine-protein phosphatase 6 regulatory subunit 3
VQEDILQETKAQNKKLLDYLVRPETLERLFYYVLGEPEEGADTKRRFKYPFLSCEILCSDVWTISEAILERHPALAERLFAFFAREGGRLPALQATYAAKVAGSLLQRRPREAALVMRRQADLVGALLRNLANGAVMDLLLKLVQVEDAQEPVHGADDDAAATGGSIMAWLCEARLIPRLLEQLEPGRDADLHENAGQALVDIVLASTTQSSHSFSSSPPPSASASASVNPLVAELESEASVGRLLECARAGSSSLTHACAVLIELLNRHVQERASQQPPDQLPGLLRLLLPHLPRLVAQLREPPAALLSTSVGEIRPLGFARLRLVELLVAMAKTNFAAVDEALREAGAFETCISLFFELPWNNFLHALVEQMLVGVLRGENRALKLHLVREARLAERLMEAFRASEAEQACENGVRLGHMGFVLSIATYLVNEAAGDPPLQEALSAVPGWDAFAQGPLKEAKALEDRPLGGQRPPAVDLHSPNQDAALASQMVFRYLAQHGFDTSQLGLAAADDDDDDDEDDNDDALGFDDADGAADEDEGGEAAAAAAAAAAGRAGRFDELDPTDASLLLAATGGGRGEADEEDPATASLARALFGQALLRARPSLQPVACRPPSAAPHSSPSSEPEPMEVDQEGPGHNAAEEYDEMIVHEVEEPADAAEAAAAPSADEDDVQRSFAGTARSVRRTNELSAVQMSPPAAAPVPVPVPSSSSMFSAASPLSAPAAPAAPVAVTHEAADHQPQSSQLSEPAAQQASSGPSPASPQPTLELVFTPGTGSATDSAAASDGAQAMHVVAESSAAAAQRSSSEQQQQQQQQALPDGIQTVSALVPAVAVPAAAANNTATSLHKPTDQGGFVTDSAAVSNDAQQTTTTAVKSASPCAEEQPPQPIQQ